MFWGLILKANKKYTQTTKQAFHVSQAALDVTSCNDGPIQLFLTYENIKYLICTLRKNTTEQVMLDLNFKEGDEISLQSQGSGTIHISGYLTDLNDEFDGLSEEESDIGEEMLPLPKKSKKQEPKANNSKASKKVEAAAEEDDDDDEDDSDFNGEEGAPGADSDDDEDDDDEDDDEGDDDDDDDDDEDEEEDESEEEEVQQPKAKQIKLEKPSQNGIESQKKDGKQKKNKKDGAQQQQQQQQQQGAQKQKGGEQTIAGGVKIEDIRVGSGPEAKTGKRAHVYYEGRLKSNNKVFDSLKQGGPFKFGLGRGEVIKGWDVGVVGMKVGGKRRITCPPHMAYGVRGSPPTIPPNSTLVFEVELKGVQ